MATAVRPQEAKRDYQASQDREPTRRQRHQSLLAALKIERQSFEVHWREIGDFIKPRRARFTQTDQNRGDRRSQRIIDSAATFAARTLAAGMMTGLTSPARIWHRLTTADGALAEQGAVKTWLHEVNELIATTFLRSNFYNALTLVYSDMGVFGTGAVMIEEDDEHTIHCTAFPIGTYCLGTDHKGRVRVFAREFRLTVRQLVEQFAPLGAYGSRGVREREWSSVRPETRHAWREGRLDQWRDIVHIIEPNPDADPARIGSRFKPFRSCYWEVGSDDTQYLREEGYDEFPVLAPRWEVAAGDVYGTDCPGMTALGDVKQLQAMKRLQLQGIEKQVKPPMVGPTALKNSAASILPGGMTYVDETGDKKFRPAHEVRLDLSHLRAEIDSVQYLIRRAFYEDLFLMLDQGLKDRTDITATEILERREEKLLALGPVLEQTNTDLLDPAIDRVFAILERRGQIPDPPPELEGQRLKVEYLSIMAQAQKSTGAGGIEALSGFVTNLMTMNPNDTSPLDKIDRDQMIDEYAEIRGVPPRIVVPDEQVAAIRQQRAQAQQAMEQTAMLKDAAAGAKDLASADTTGKNALTDLLGSGALGSLAGV